MRNESTPQYSPHVFQAMGSFEKQIPQPGVSTHMQIRAAWVFSITCVITLSFTFLVCFGPSHLSQWSTRSAGSSILEILMMTSICMTCMQATKSNEKRTPPYIAPGPSCCSLMH